MTTKNQKNGTDEESKNTLDDVFVFLKSVPNLPQYKGLAAADAYSSHAHWLEERAKESDKAAIPKGSWAEQHHSAAAKRSRLRAKLCSLVANGQSVSDAIQSVFHQVAKEEGFAKRLPTPEKPANPTKERTRTKTTKSKPATTSKSVTAITEAKSSRSTRKRSTPSSTSKSTVTAA
ncbi:MAG: hypothetical protein V7638_3894 [Acidobacteriota bacterium]|jgi:hypothetical protein